MVHFGPDELSHRGASARRGVNFARKGARMERSGEGRAIQLAAEGSSAYPASMEPDSPNSPKRSLTETIFVIFLRVVAVACLWFGLQYWSMLVGYSHAGSGRFDLLNLPWRVAAAGLAVVFPVAALGLWLGGSWGPVIWVLAAGGQILMFGVWPEIFGRNPLAIVLHSVVALVYMAFRLALWLESRHKQDSVTVDLL